MSEIVKSAVEAGIEKTELINQIVERITPAFTIVDCCKRNGGPDN